MGGQPGGIYTSAPARATYDDVSDRGLEEDRLEGSRWGNQSAGQRRDEKGRDELTMGGCEDLIRLTALQEQLAACYSGEGNLLYLDEIKSRSETFSRLFVSIAI